MSDNAMWTGEAPDVPETAPTRAQLGAVASWLPASVLRRQAIEDRAEAREARRAEQEREARREAAREKGVAAYRAAAEARGEVVSAVALATGENIGRSMADVFADAVAAADHQDAREAAKARREGQSEPRHVIVGRSDGWYGSTYELDRAIERARDLHSDLVMYQAGRDYPAALEATRAKSHSAHRRNVTRSEYCVHCTEAGVDDDTSYLLHSDPELNCPPTPPAQYEQAERRGGRTPMIYR